MCFPSFWIPSAILLYDRTPPTEMKNGPAHSCSILFFLLKLYLPQFCERRKDKDFARHWIDWKKQLLQIIVNYATINDTLRGGGGMWQPCFFASGSKPWKSNSSPVQRPDRNRSIYIINLSIVSIHFYPMLPLSRALYLISQWWGQIERVTWKGPVGQLHSQVGVGVQFFSILIQLQKILHGKVQI